jgi:selenocysteine lyase/cysteine desulfurase
MTTDYRAEFDIPRDICYLNASYMTPQPRRVLEACFSGARRRSQPWTVTPDDFFTEVDALREAFARQIRCAPDNIAIVPSAGYGVACATANLQTGPGDLILSMHDQFPSNYYAWRRQALSSGAEFLVVGPEDGQSWADALIAAIKTHGDKIKVATLEGHHWSTAEYIDIDVVVPALRDIGAKVVMDLTQTLGAFPLDITRTRPDFMVASGYKWQFCPYGVSFLYVDENYFDGVPIEEAWMSRDGAEDFSRLAEFTDDYKPGARRFEAGEKSSFSNIAGALAAIRQLDEWGIDNISAHLAETNATIADILARQGFETPPADTRAPHFQGARLPATDPRKLAERLIANGVYASVRGDRLRVAPHVYIDDEDLNRFEDVLKAAQSA